MKFFKINFRLLFVLAASVLAAGCIPSLNNAVAPTEYDLGPTDFIQTDAFSSKLDHDMVIIPAIRSRGILNSKLIVYRLAYAQAHEPRTYTESRWATEPTEMIRLYLQQTIGKKYPITLTSELYQDANWVVWLSLEDFSQNFSSETHSEGVVQIRCTLQYKNTIVGQKVFYARIEALSADAPGAVEALSKGVHQVSHELFEWLDTLITQHKK